MVSPDNLAVMGISKSVGAGLGADYVHIVMSQTETIYKINVFECYENAKTFVKEKANQIKNGFLDLIEWAFGNYSEVE